MKNLLDSIWGMEASAFKAFIFSQVLSALFAGVVLVVIINSFLYIRNRMYFKEPIVPRWAVKLFDAVKLYVAQRQCSGARGAKARTEKEKRLIPRRLEQLVKGSFLLSFLLSTSFRSESIDDSVFCVP